MYFLTILLAVCPNINPTILCAHVCDVNYAACYCNALYSQDLQCNSAGKCTCKAGVSEDKCTKCADNYYNLTTAGVYLVSI